MRAQHTFVDPDGVYKTEFYDAFGELTNTEYAPILTEPEFDAGRDNEVTLSSGDDVSSGSLIVTDKDLDATWVVFDDHYGDHMKEKTVLIQ